MKRRNHNKRAQAVARAEHVEKRYVDNRIEVKPVEARIEVKKPVEARIEVKKPVEARIEVKQPIEARIEVKKPVEPIIDAKKSVEVKTEVKKSVEPKAEVIKHPLEHTWCYWHITNNKRNWEDNLVNLTSFEFVEDYWCLYHCMKQPSELDRGKDYAVFKKDIRPMWEDRANKAGGRWLINFDKKHSNDLDSIWLDMVLLMIGENFTFPDMICGAVVNVRVRSKVALWVANCNNRHALLEIGRTLRDKLNVNGRLSFQQHNSTQNLFNL